MDVISVSINACIWQSGSLNPVLVKDKNGCWTLPAEEFDLEADKNFARQTLERALYKQVKGTLNPLNFRRRGYVLRTSLADPKPWVLFTSPSGNRCILHPRNERKVNVQIILPLLETGSVLAEELPQGLDLYQRVCQRGEPVKPLVRQLIDDKQRDWSLLRLSKMTTPMRPNFGWVAERMRQKGVDPELAARVTRPQNEAYWHPPPEKIKNVA